MLCVSCGGCFIVSAAIVIVSTLIENTLECHSKWTCNQGSRALMLRGCLRVSLVSHQAIHPIF